jgi:KUP system potassium uptake protein
MRVRWDLGLAVTLAIMAAFLFIDLSFFGANAIKIPDGGWFPLVVAVLVFTLLVTWRRGREILSQRLRETELPLTSFLKDLSSNPLPRVPGTAVFMTADIQGVPSALLHNLKHNKVLHERVVILNVRFADTPFTAEEGRLEVTKITEDNYLVILRYGFMDDIDVPKALAVCRCGMPLDMMDTTFFFSRETLIPTKGGGMMLWREHLFATMLRSAASPMTFFQIPANRVIELGTQVEI